MAQFVDFDESNTKKQGSGKGKGGTDFLKLEAGKKYKIRLIGSPYRYFQHWEPVSCRSPEKDAAGNIIDPLMLKGFQPRERYSIWVLDREDQNKLKLMDFPPTLYESFVEWKLAFNKEPGGSDGPDWSIKIEIPPGGTKRQQRYKAIALDRVAVTEEERAVIKEAKIKDRLLELRKPNTPEEINAMLAKKDGGTSLPDAKAQTQQKTVVKAKEASALVDQTVEDAGDDDVLNF